MSGNSAAVQLSPDEALGLANHLVLSAREAIYQSGKAISHNPDSRSALVVRSTPEGATLSMGGPETELIATLDRSQATAIAKVITSAAGYLQIAGSVRQFNISTTL